MDYSHVHKQILEAVESAESIVITSHISPDGDSVGSSLALYHLLLAIGKKTKVCHADAASNAINWLSGAADILTFDAHSKQVKDAIEEADLIFCLDYNEVNRVGKEMAVLLSQSQATKIMIDHHLHPSDFCSISYSDTTSCSTAQLIYEWMVGCGKQAFLNQEIATAIYLGIMTDSGSFRFPSVHARTHEIIADLMHTGIPHYKIHENVFDVNSLQQLQLKSYAIAQKMEIIPSFPVSYIVLTKQELDSYDYSRGDLDGLVNVPMSINGIAVSVLFTEVEDRIKISFRAKGNYAVNVLAKEHFNGGGHQYASGGVSFESLESTVEKFKTMVPIFFS
jgi:phosphoesterase RecJ-like protein